MGTPKLCIALFALLCLFANLGLQRWYLEEKEPCVIPAKASSPDPPPAEGSPLQSSSSPSPVCRAVFSLNPGRSGSKFLSEIFQKLPNTHGVHEELAFGEYSLSTKVEGMEATYDRRKAQLQKIVGPVLERGEMYAESSLLFIHVLYDTVMDWIAGELGCRVDIIVLRRYLPWIAESYLRNSTGPEFTRPDFRDPQTPWMWLSPSMATLTRIPSEKASQLPWQIRECLYNLIETEARTQWFIRTFSHRPNVHIHEFRTEEVTTPAGLRRLLDGLDVDVHWSEEQLHEMACTPKNLKPGDSLFSLKDIERRFIPQYMREAKRQRIWVPTLPQLQPAIFNSTCGGDDKPI